MSSGHVERATSFPPFRPTSGELAAYKVPRHVAVFARQADLPLLDSGKVDRRRLTQLLAERFGAATGVGA